MTEANETNGNDQSDPSQSHPMPLHMLLETSQHSNIEHAIHNVIRKNFLEQRSITWKPIRVELVINQSLTSDFFAVRKKFELASNGNRCEFDERYAFLIDNDQQVSEICRHGYQCTETSFNVLGHSKYGVYVCKYADVCIRRASVRRTWEGNMAIKMIIFKIVEGKQTAALVRKGPKLQPIAPTPQFTSHCSVITPKETDDLEKQFDQSQIFLYEFDGRETIKRPHHCLPFAVVSLIQNGSEWPANFDELDVGMDLLDTDTLRVVAQADDPLLKSKLQENPQLAEAAAAALEHIYQEEPAPPTSSDQQSSPASKIEINGIQNASDSQTPVTSTVMVNGSSVSSSDEHSPKTSLSPSSTADGLTNHVENGTAAPPPPPPPPPTAPSSTSTSPANVPSNATVTSSTPAGSTSGTIPAAAFRQQASVVGAMPAAAAMRAAPGAVYATAAGLTNGLGGQIFYGGIPIDALRGYPGTVASPYAIAAQAGQGLQQPALFAAQLQALAQQQQQQQQAAQLAAAIKQQQQQQQQQSLIGGIPAGYALVRTANGGLALLAQGPQANAATAMPAQAAVQQPFIALNAAGQPTAAAATAARLPMAMVGGQPQQIIYQYAGQPGLQAAPTQYIQLPANYAQQSGAVGNAILSGGGAGSAAYGNQTQIQYLATSPTSNTPTGHAGATNVQSVVPSSSASSIQAQAAQTLISPQKQSAATATAAAIQQQQQYQYAYAQQQQQATTNGTAGANPYHTAMSQAQAQAQQQQQLQAAALAQQQQQQQYGFVQQIQYATQQAMPQQVYYAPASGQTIYQAGGQSYILASAAPSTASATSTGAPIMYSSGPVLHNGAAQQQQQQQQQQQAAQSQQQQQQLAYQILSSTAHHGQQTSSSAGPGVVAQQPPQLIQRTNVVPQVRHHPYRN